MKENFFLFAGSYGEDVTVLNDKIIAFLRKLGSQENKPQ
jgi:hypothetical protein